MPFGLLNACETFYRTTYFDFKDIIGKIIEIYQYDLIVFAKLSHARKVFDICRNYGVSLNITKLVLGI